MYAGHLLSQKRVVGPFKHIRSLSNADTPQIEKAKSKNGLKSLECKKCIPIICICNLSMWVCVPKDFVSNIEV